MTIPSHRISCETSTFKPILAARPTFNATGQIRPDRQASFLALLARHWALFVCVVAMAAVFPASLAAQQFAPVPALDFSTTAGAGSPLQQMVTITSTGANIDFTAKATTNSGGNWLSIPTAFGCCGAQTPFAFTIAAIPASAMGAGTYTGQIVVTPSANTISPLTIPVKLVIHPASAAFFDQTAGGLTFTLEAGGNVPPGQALQIRNGGAGSLAWTASTSTADGGAWLSLSETSGTAPSNLTVGVVLSKLPELGITAGTLTGQVLLKSASDTVTVPITVIVGASVIRQIDPLNFTKSFAGANPLPQVLDVASSGSPITFYVSTIDSTGGNWLTVKSNAFGCCGSSTPAALTFTVNPSVTLAAGSYMAEVIVYSSDGSQSLSIPVTLAVDPSTEAFFDDVPGALDFSMATGGDTPPSQDLQIRNAGTGTLAWTASATTADGGKWLSVSSAGGTAPDIVTVSVDPANLPSNSLVAGTFVGQVVLQSAGSRVTIPVSLPVGSATFRQVNPLNFTKAYGGANPLSQVFNIASTGASFPFAASVVSSTGGNWLSMTPSSFGCCGSNTPQAVAVNVNPAITLAAGTYTAEILVESETGNQELAVPVTLTVEPAATAFFDALPGQMSFSMITKGIAPPAQTLPIRNAGTGTLDWAATTTTSDGGAWLNIAPASGVAPANPQVSVNPVNLPGGGLVAGTFTGQIILESSGNLVTVPVSMTVGASVFRQVNPLEFTMTYGGANPLPQAIGIASTGANFAFFATTVSSTGGNWLSINPSSYGCCGVNTPYAIYVGVNPAVTLAAGTYSAEIVITSSDGAQGLTVPVTLNIEPKTASFFDSLPGELSFSMPTGGSAPPAQPLQIRNAGAGALAWTAALTTSDGGAWLAISAPGGNAPAVPAVSVIPSKLPGGGVTAGTFSGQVILETSGNRVTIPVSMAVGASVFRQVNALNFNMVFGGANPLPQLINVTSTGANFPFFATAVNSTGGNWLQINPNSYGCCGANTPQNLIVTVNPTTTLAVGTYTAQIDFEAGAGSPSMVVPVTLTVNPPTATFFDDMPGGISFFQVTAGATPAAQSVPIRNAGAGTLDWTAATTTSDGGNWLAISAAAGTAPSSLSVSIKSANLPGKGLIAGIFNGQILLETGTGRETIPVQAVVGASVFEPIAPIGFTMPYAGSYPTYQVLNVTTSGSNFAFLGLKASANGGNWLTINPGSFGCCGDDTPQPIEVSVNPATTLGAGSYVGELIFTSSAGDQGIVVPVTLTIDGTGAAATPTFSPKGGTYTSAQTVTISGTTRGAAIHYTLNGSVPTKSSPVYSAPISVTASETINAIAIAPGFGQSAVGTAVYTLTAPTAPTPAPAMAVTIAEALQGATVYYTTNGSTPTTASAVYMGPIAVTATTTLKFIAADSPNYNQSAVKTVTITVQ